MIAKENGVEGMVVVQMIVEIMVVYPMYMW